MKVSLNHIRTYRDQYNWSTDPAPDGIDALVEKIGSQLGAVEEVINLGEKYQGIIIAKVVSCIKHDNSDHLNVCLIDDGGVAQDVARDEAGHVQVVCGAPNVREGLLVAWLPPGATVPESVGKDPFVLSARDIRGVVSNGMLASMRELALGEDHDGILELDEADAQPGADFAKTYHLDDYIIDIENKMFTHRPDCFGMIGVARELAGISQQPFTSPDWYSLSAQIPAPEMTILPLTVTNELPELVPRFMVIPMSNITVKPSPLWLQINLHRLGVRPINNVVDLTNYYMLLTGQPMHAYDYDKVKALDGEDSANIVVRFPRSNEEITLLNGKTVKPRPEAIMIATKTTPIGIGGVMGGADTEVDDNTKNIIIECASFDMYSVRRTSMAQGLFTDAVTRFNKGQSPLQNIAVLARTLPDFTALAGGVIAGPVIDDNRLSEAMMSRGSIHPPVPVTTEFINQRLGTSMTAERMKTLLENVECSVVVEGDELTVTAPFWRTDIEMREDLVEEVGRLEGFDTLPLVLPRRTITPSKRDSLFDLKNTIRTLLSRAGANEVLTYSFVHGNLLDKVGQKASEAFELSNALSPELQYYRLSLTPSLLDKVHPNIKAGYDEFALFEVGKAHTVSEVDEDGVPTGFDRLALVVATNPKLAAKKYANSPAYYQARNYLTTVLRGLNIESHFSFQSLANADAASHMALEQMLELYEPSRSAIVYDGERIVGVVGEYRRSVLRALKLPEFCAGFEVFVNALTAMPQNRYVAVPRFPQVTQDITLKVPNELSYHELESCLVQQLESSKPTKSVTQLSPIDIYQRADDLTNKQVTFRLTIASYEKTLTDPDVTKLLADLTRNAHEKFGAEQI
jgi:phenylalanyl-tRNA synthetase beta chain